MRPCSIFLATVLIFFGQILEVPVCSGQTALQTVRVVLTDDLPAARKELLEGGGTAGPISHDKDGVVVSEGVDANDRPVRLEAETKEVADAADILREARAAVDDYLDAFNRGDLDSSLTIYADDPRFHWVDEGSGTTYLSKKQVESATRAVYREVTEVELTFSGRELKPVSQRQVLLSTAFAQRMRFGSGPEIAFSGRITVLLEKTGQNWQFLAGHSAGSTSE